MAGKESVFSCVSSKKTVFNLQSLKQPYFDYILRQGKRKEKCVFAPSHAYFVFFADTMTDTDCDTWAHSLFALQRDTLFDIFLHFCSSQKMGNGGL